MVIVAAFALLALFSIISIVMSTEDPDRLTDPAHGSVPVDDARSPLGANDSLSHRRPGPGRGVNDSVARRRHHEPGAAMAEPGEASGGQVRLEAGDAVGTDDRVVRGPGRAGPADRPRRRSTASPSSGRPNRIEPCAHTRTLS